MGRKSRQVVDYFPHMCKHGRSLRIIETHYQNDGYSLWFKLLECIGASDGHVYDCKIVDNLEDLLAYAHLTEEKFNEIMSKFARLGMIDRQLWETCRLAWSDNFVAGLGDVYDKRICGRPKRPEIIADNIIPGAEIPGNGDNRGSYPQRNLTEPNVTINLTEPNVTFSSVDNFGGDGKTNPDKMSRAEIYYSDELSKREKADLLALPECPKCRGFGFVPFEPAEGEIIDKDIARHGPSMPCKCWDDPNKYK